MVWFLGRLKHAEYFRSWPESSFNSPQVILWHIAMMLFDRWKPASIWQGGLIGGGRDKNCGPGVAVGRTARWLRVGFEAIWPEILACNCLVHTLFSGSI